MEYQKAIEVLYNQAPMFQHLGKRAYKSGLENTYILDERLGHPHKNYHTIHVAGTNGKGSTSHLLAAVLQAQGYKVGLYTSPHLRDFRERIRVNGVMISEGDVADFIEEVLPWIEELHPSFFEITTALAFKYFEKQNVDVAVIEVGLGGRIDCTNIISPLLSIITNISLDHTDLLGPTLVDIAKEKSGIIKANIPVVIGEYQPEVAPVFEQKAREAGTTIVYASKEWMGKPLPDCQMKGCYQDKNRATAMVAISILRKGGVLNISDDAVVYGFSNVVSLTGIMGRWQILQEKNPKIVCDTGHNIGGISYVVSQLSHEKYEKLRIVIGMVSDKDIRAVLSVLPKNAVYYFTKASIPRALNEVELQTLAGGYGLIGKAYSTVKEAFNSAKEDADSGDLIYVGGSNFIVAEVV